MSRPSIRFDLFPGGVSRAVTLSYDDGVVEDRRLVEVLNRYGLKGSFHLNSGTLGRENNLRLNEIASLFEGHEISAHSVTHPHLDSIPREELIAQIIEDRRALEACAGYPVRGMSYPYGTHNREILQMLPALGIEYARTAESSGQFNVPPDLFRWQPTCHHNQELMAKTEAFFSENAKGRLRLLYVFGHSYEFPRDNNWDLIECFAERVQKEDVWRATNIEIADYLGALRQLRFSIDGSRVRNLSHLPVWITWNGEKREIPSGSLLAV